MITLESVLDFTLCYFFNSEEMIRVLEECRLQQTNVWIILDFLLYICDLAQEN